LEVGEILTSVEAAAAEFAASAGETDVEGESSGGTTETDLLDLPYVVKGMDFSFSGISSAANDAADEGVPVGDGVDVYEHDQYGSIQIDKVNGLEDDEFQALRKATDQPFVTYDPGADVNFVPQDQLGEVPDV